MANKIVEGKQITVCLHVGDCKLSHEHPKVIDETVNWLRAEYKSIFKDGLGAMKVHRGKVHVFGDGSGFLTQREMYCHYA